MTEIPGNATTVHGAAGSPGGVPRGPGGGIPRPGRAGAATGLLVGEKAVVLCHVLASKRNTPNPKIGFVSEGGVVVPDETPAAVFTSEQAEAFVRSSRLRFEYVLTPYPVGGVPALE